MASRQPMEQPAETADARTRILQAALEVFASKGYAQASTREICQRAGANVAGIHYYFGDKASLYKELMQIPEHMVRPPEILVCQPHAHGTPRNRIGHYPEGLIVTRSQP